MKIMKYAYGVSF